MTAEPLPGLGPLDGLDPARLPVFGFDPSTVRVSVGVVLRDRSVWWDTLSLPQLGTDSHRFALAYERLVPWLAGLAERWVPKSALVEQPFAVGRRVHPSSQQMVGVLLAAAGWALGRGVFLDTIDPPQWKKRALGPGRGHAKPPEYMEWARSTLGYTGSLMDEAAALGVAVSEALRVSAHLAA